LVEFLFQNGLLSGNGEKFRAVCGRAGTTPHKEEGDGATPRGPLPLLRILYRADRLRAPRCAVAVEPIGMTDGWCDDIADPAYNKPVRLPYAASHEALWREDNVYDVIGVLGWNLSPILPGRGSAIFLHVATPDFAPTAGCIALALPDLLKCLEVGLRGITVAG
jgi:L,D-peptidoglycan transpeptidase YkuD (ErfK/YbiS/YcfS/YnhG family)